MITELFDSDFYVTNIVFACLVDKGNGALIHRNRPSHGFAYQVSGENLYRFSDGTTLRVKEGDLIYLPRHSDYNVEKIVPGSCYAINFQLHDSPNAKPFKLRVRSQDIIPCFKNAVRAFRLHRYDYREKCCRELYGIVLILKESLYNPKYVSTKQQTVLKKAEEYIAERYTEENIPIASLAKHCGVSEVYLRKIFRTQYHLSPIDYINGRKLSYANAMLASGEYSVSEVCFMSGFNDVSYFCRVYKNRYGFPPNKTRGNSIRE